MIALRASIRKRLIDRSEAKGDCILWLGSKNHKGYGTISIDGKVERTHRISFALANPKWNGSGMVLHKCDRPSCINPEHLYLGDAKQNAMDMVNRGRATQHGHKGSHNATAIIERVGRDSIIRAFISCARNCAATARIIGCSQHGLRDYLIRNNIAKPQGQRKAWLLTQKA